jgi:hypothetical protein
MMMVGLPLICVLTFQLVKDMAVYEMGTAMAPASQFLEKAMAEEIKINQLNGELAAIEEKKADRARKLAELAAKQAKAKADLEESLKRNDATRQDAITFDFRKKSCLRWKPARRHHRPMRHRAAYQERSICARAANPGGPSHQVERGGGPFEMPTRQNAEYANGRTPTKRPKPNTIMPAFGKAVNEGPVVPGAPERGQLILNPRLRTSTSNRPEPAVGVATSAVTAWQVNADAAGARN